MRSRPPASRRPTSLTLRHLRRAAPAAVAALPLALPFALPLPLALPLALALALALPLAPACGDDPAAPPTDAGPPDPPDAARDASAFPPLDAGEPDAGPDPSTPARGLHLTAQIELPRLGPHLSQVLPHGDVVYVANSWDMLTAVLREPDGNLLVTLPAPPWPDGVMSRCTAIAVHDPSHTLYCASDEPHPIIAFDISNPERPTPRDRLALTFADGTHLRSLHVAGDTLYMSRFDRGLFVAPIDPATGALGAPVVTALAGNARFVDSDPATGTRVALTSDSAAGGGAFHVLEGAPGLDTHAARSLVLPGTMQDVSLRGARAAVALGSEGAMLLDVTADPPRVVAHVVPPAVATAADVDGDAFAVMTLTGAYLYDLRESPPRLADFVPAGRTMDRNGGVMLSGRFVDHELVTSDWIFVERFTVNLDGVALVPDLPRAANLAPDADLDLELRSVSDHDVLVRLRAAPTGDPIDTMLPAHGEAVVHVSGAQIAASPLENELHRLGVQVFLDGAARSFYTTLVRIRIRPPYDGAAPWDRPAVGDPFPSLAYAVTDNTTFHVPAIGTRNRVMFFGTDCVAMWPVVEDAAYLTRTHRLDDDADALLLNSFNLGRDRWLERWDMVGVPWGHYGYLAPPELIAENGTERVYDDRFMMRDMPGAAAHPTDFLVGADGVVEAVETYYRGAFPLRAH